MYDRVCTSTLLLVAALALLVGAPRPATAQSPTPTTTIQNGNGTVRWQTFYNGGLLAPGTIPSDGTQNDSIPAEGAGTRMMWYPEKAAFRAGRVGLSQGKSSVWDADSVGRYSVALNVDTKASGYAATAMGNNTTASANSATATGFLTTASGASATAMGSQTTASASQATAMGFQTTASATQATAMGRKTTASANSATAMGDNAEASGKGATAMGIQAEANGEGATALGNETVAGPFSTAMGEGSVAGAIGATAMGEGSDAVEQGATAMGLATTVESKYGTSMGYKTTVEGEAATAMGSSSEAIGDFSTAMGRNTRVSFGAEAATAMGLGTEAESAYSLSIGQFNKANSPGGSCACYFVVGSGTGANNRSDALVLDKSGDLSISGTLTENSDRRLKEQIEPLGEGVLRKLADLRPVRYKFKNKRTHPSGEQIGLVAQDVRKEFPALVSEGANGMLSLAYPKLTAVLLKGLQEQQAELEERQSQIRSLQTENEQIKKRLAALETKVGRSTAHPAGLAGPWGIGLLIALGLGGLGGALLARRRS